jgi:hypothetical protein
MPPEALHVIGFDPGGTSGWARLTVPRLSLYDDEPGEILEWDYGEITGPEPQQIIELARLVRGVQSLDYRVGPLIVGEDFDVAETVTTDAEVLYSPVRLIAMIRMTMALAEIPSYTPLFADAELIVQSRGMAKSTATDDRLKAWGLYDEHSGKHCRDATRHAITMIRRFDGSPELLDAAWPYLAREPVH